MVNGLVVGYIGVGEYKVPLMSIIIIRVVGSVGEEGVAAGKMGTCKWVPRKSIFTVQQHAIIVPLLLRHLPQSSSSSSFTITIKVGRIFVLL